MYVSLSLDFILLVLHTPRCSFARIFEAIGDLGLGFDCLFLCGAMLDSLSEKFEKIFKKLRGSGVLTEQNIAEALKEVRLALLEADVNFKIVKDFIERVREKAVGQEVLQSLTPGHQVVKVVWDELGR